MYTAKVVESDEAYHVKVYWNGKHTCTVDAFTPNEADMLVFVLMQTQDHDLVFTVGVDNVDRV